MSVGSLVVAVLTLIATIYRWRMEDNGKELAELEARTKEELSQIKRDLVKWQTAAESRLLTIEVKVASTDTTIQRWQGADLVGRVGALEDIQQEQRVTVASLTADAKHVIALISDVKNTLRPS